MSDMAGSRIVYGYRDRVMERLSEIMVDEIDWEDLPEQCGEELENAHFLFEAAARDSADSFAERADDYIGELMKGVSELLGDAHTVIMSCAKLLDDADKLEDAGLFQDGKLGAEVLDRLTEVSLMLGKHVYEPPG